MQNSETKAFKGLNLYPMGKAAQLIRGDYGAHADMHRRYHDTAPPPPDEKAAPRKA